MAKHKQVDMKPRSQIPRLRDAETLRSLLCALCVSAVKEVFMAWPTAAW